jgi:uncharacterized protein
MSGHEHGHESGHGHESEHERGHATDWLDELEGLRHEARHYYLHGFNWRGHEPPQDFEGPRFYGPAPEWRVRARLDRSAPATGDEVTLPTSTGQLRQMTVAGQLVFPGAEGGEHRLTVYRTHSHDQDEMLFVPFRDATSGSETYGAGRYLDLPYHDGDDYDLDFNYAYNPSCAFSPAYDCPFPPPGNRIDTPVRAGEMVPFEH